MVHTLIIVQYNTIQYKYIAIIFLFNEVYNNYYEGILFTSPQKIEKITNWKKKQKQKNCK